ncbi:MAG: peptidylprolyl isomerase [Gammaproteobacteria bacterium]|nr:MAG: peptidylprolyl isomerase [Gammaproteobacteria bacterium]
MVILETNQGNIKIQLYSKEAPISCKNFENYIKNGFYDGTIFHRVIKGFMVQGGGMDADMNEKKTSDPIKNEADNGLKNSTGTLAMARTSDPDSATAQFFINVNDNMFLNHSSKTTDGWGYCVFAVVTEGMDVAHKIEQMTTGNKGFHQDVPTESIIIEKAYIT